MLMHLDQ